MTQKIRVLLIDDDPEQCETLGDILADHDCDVTPCTDRSRAEALAGSARYDLLLVDLVMNGMTGLGLLRRLSAGSHGCVVVLTGSFDTSAKRAALAAGADAVMEKPVDIPLLLSLVRDVQATGNCNASSALVPAP
jgi:DNA-binding response OmpR family regulator